MSEGCTALGAIYEQGFLIKKDMSKAKELYEKVCDGGDIDGCKLLKLNQ